MEGKKQYGMIFLRTLAIFLVFWLVMVWVLTVNNRENRESWMEYRAEYDSRNLARNLLVVQEGSAPEARKPYLLQDNLTTYYNEINLSVYRVFDEQMNEVARTPLSWGSFDVEPATGANDHFILFDQVLTDEEQIAFAECLQADDHRMASFYGEFYVGLAEGNVPNGGLYGEVTGIYDEASQTILPQKLVYYYEDSQVTLMESDHAMFDGAELTTLRFAAARVSSALNWGSLSPEQQLQLFRRAEERLDELVKKERSSNWGGVLAGETGTAEFTTTWEGVPLGCSYEYIPWRVAAYDLGFTYVLTFLAALLAAVLVAHIQIKSMKKERQFTRAVAHEIKTPAAVLRAYAEALNEGVEPERQEEYLCAMMEESDRMAVLVSELLDLSRMEGAAGVVKSQEVDWTALIRTSFERLRTPMSRCRLELELDLQQVSVRGDRKRLQQVADNLASNALRHGEPGVVRVSLRREGDRTVLSVQNRCPSLTEEQVKRLWEPFYKADHSRSGEGSGLGLVMVRNIVRLYGGSCSARMVSDQIRFCIELPCHEDGSVAKYG